MKEEAEEQFEYWLSDMDDAIERFVQAAFPRGGHELDFSPRSLNEIEAWVADRYPSVEQALADSEAETVDGAGRYVGEVFRKNIGGTWMLELNNPKDIYFGLPVLDNVGPLAEKLSPHSLVTASLDRRGSEYIMGVFKSISGQ